MNPFRIIQSYVLPSFQKPNGPLRVIEGAAIPTRLQYIKSIDVPHKLHPVYRSPVSSLNTFLGHYHEKHDLWPGSINSIRIGKQGLWISFRKSNVRRNGTILSQSFNDIELTSAKMLTVLCIFEGGKNNPEKSSIDEI